MNNALLIDTSIIIDALRQETKDNTDLIFYANNYRILKISIITHAELFSGKSVWENTEKTIKLEKVLNVMEIIPINPNISKIVGKLRALNQINLIDGIIAATAIEEQIPLATLNKKHFERIPSNLLQIV